MAATRSVDSAATVSEQAVRVLVDTTAPTADADVRDATAYKFGCDQTEAEVALVGGPRVTVGGTTIYIGTRQVSSSNQDPRLVRFDDGEQTWCRRDIERSSVDGRGYGLLWDGGDELYAVFGVDGTNGSPERDLRRATIGGWLSSYGAGGGARVAVLARIDAATGDLVGGTFLRSELSNGRTNSFTVVGLELLSSGAGVRMQADSFFSPLDENRQRLRCEGDSPFAVTYDLTSQLDSVTSARVADDACV